MAKGRLPDFIVIGAVKAATTWIQVQLQANPAIYMPDPEPHFFSREYHFGEEHYRRWFEPAPDSASLIGEKSADYLSDPEAPRRIAAMLPDVRLVVQLRDPVERAYSHYKMFFRRGLVSASPEQYLRNPDNAFPQFLLDGLYGRHIRHWQAHFDRQQILAFRYEDVATDAERIVDRVSRHIGAATVFDPAAASQRENDSRARILPLTIRNLLGPLKESAKPFRGKSWFEGARSLLAKEIAYPPLSDGLRRHLEEFYREDIALAEDLLALDLSGWRNRDGAFVRAGLMT